MQSDIPYEIDPVFDGLSVQQWMVGLGESTASVQLQNAEPEFYMENTSRPKVEAAGMTGPMQEGDVAVAERTQIASLPEEGFSLMQADAAQMDEPNTPVQAHPVQLGIPTTVVQSERTNHTEQSGSPSEPTGVGKVDDLMEVGSSVVVPSDTTMSNGCREDSIPERDVELVKKELVNVYVNRALTGKGAGLTLTPLGASAAYFASSETWRMHVAHSKIIDPDAPFDEENIVALLFRNVVRHEKRLQHSLLEAKDASLRTFARHAFRTRVERTTQLDFLHSFLQLVLADRMAWILTDRPEHDDRPISRPHMPPEMEKDAEKYKEFFDLAVRWPETLGGFLEIWDAYFMKKPKSQKKTVGWSQPAVDSLPPPVAMDGSAAISPKQKLVFSLIGGIVDAENRVKLAKVQDNFCQAAMGIFALAQREAMRPDPGNAVNYEDPKLADIIRVFYPHVPDEIANMDDYTFLRPLYIAACISPVCLLAPIQFSSSSKCRLGLSQILQGMNATALQPHSQRRDIEYDLLKIMFTLVVKGRNAFEPCMKAALKEWQTKQIICEGKPSVDASQIVKADLRSEWKRVRDESPLTYRVVQALAEKVEPPKSKKRSWEVIDLTKDEPQDWIVESVLTKRKMETSSDTDEYGSKKRRKGSPRIKEEIESEEEDLGPDLEETTRRETRSLAKQRAQDTENVEKQIHEQGEERKRREEQSQKEKDRKEKAAQRKRRLRALQKKQEEVAEAATANVDQGKVAEEHEDGSGATGTGDGVEREGRNVDMSSQGVATDSEGRNLNPDECPGEVVPTHNMPDEYNRRNIDHPRPCCSIPILRPMLPRPRSTHEVVPGKSAEARPVPEQPEDDINKNGPTGFPKEPDVIRGDYTKADFEEVSRFVELWSSMDDALHELPHLERNNKKNIDSGIGNTWLQTFSREKWDTLSYKQRRACFEVGPIHVVGPPKYPPHGIMDINDPKLSNLIDLDSYRQCIDLTLRRNKKGLVSTIRRATIRQLLDDFEERKKHTTNRCCNFLDIPLLHNWLPLEFDDFSKYIGSSPGHWQPKTLFSAIDLGTQWAIAAHRTAYSRLHIDASGYATHVHLLHGEKAWWIARETDYRPDENGYEVSKMEFDCALLRQGDELFMPPNTPHAVLSLRDSFALGGHFYFFPTLDRTLAAMVDEHFLGEVITNAQHTVAPALLMKGLASFVYTEEARQDVDPGQIASLLILAENLSQLGPELAEDFDARNWFGSEQFMYDIWQIYRILEEAESRFLVDDTNSRCWKLCASRFRKQVEENMKITKIPFDIPEGY